MNDNRQFAIALTGRLRHGELWRLVRRFGSAKALAREVGIDNRLLGYWLNMKSAPSESSERQFSAAVKLASLANKAFEEMWPEEVRDREWLKADKRIEKTTVVDTQRLLEWRGRNKALPSPDQVLEGQEVREAVESALSTLDARERLVIEMRWGLGEYYGTPHTISEVSKSLNRSRERIYQIEQKARYKLGSVKALFE